MEHSWGMNVKSMKECRGVWFGRGRGIVWVFRSVGSTKGEGKLAS